jgi:hypothetical protein
MFTINHYNSIIYHYTAKVSHYNCMSYYMHAMVNHYSSVHVNTKVV